MVKNQPANSVDLRDSGSIAELGRSSKRGHYSILALRIPWTEEPDGLQSTGLQESDVAGATGHACPRTSLASKAPRGGNALPTPHPDARRSEVGGPCLQA